MSPEQLSFMIGSIYGSVLTLLLFPPSRQSRNRYRPPGGSYGAPRRRNPFVSDFQQQINDALDLDGYRSINYPDPSPDRRPTNPFNGERIPNPPPRKP
jgi:hypothetical protein